VDLDFHVVRENHRGRTQPAHQAASRAVEPEQTGATLGQAHLVAGDQRADRADLCRLLHADPAAGRRTADLAIGGVSLFWVLFFTAATYINAGWLREAVCMHMCPMRGSRA
jgi:hypothetical protein